MTLIELFLLLWSLVGGQYEWRNGLPDDYTATHPAALAGFSCTHGIGWVSATAPLSVVVHELAHAYDCADDGLLNGSPGHHPSFTLAPWESPAEWYAYEVVRTRRLD